MRTPMVSGNRGLGLLWCVVCCVSLYCHQVLASTTEVEITESQWDDLSLWLENIDNSTTPVSNLLDQIRGVNYNGFNGLHQDFTNVQGELELQTEYLDDILDALIYGYGDVAWWSYYNQYVNIRRNNAMFGVDVPPTGFFRGGMVGLDNHNALQAINSNILELADYGGGPGNGLGVHVLNWDDMPELIIGGDMGSFSNGWSFNSFSNTDYSAVLAGDWTNTTSTIGSDVAAVGIETNAASWSNAIPGCTVELTQNPVWTVAWPVVSFSTGGISVASTNRYFDWSEISGVSTFRTMLITMMWASLGITILAWCRGASAEQEA